VNISLFGLVVAVYVVSGIYSSVKKNKTKSTSPDKKIETTTSKQTKKKVSSKNTRKRENKEVASKSELITEVIDLLKKREKSSSKDLTKNGQVAASSEDTKDQMKNKDRDGNDVEPSNKDESFNYDEIESPLNNESIFLDFNSKEELAKAMILKEILDPPLSMRNKRSRD